MSTENKIEAIQNSNLPTQAKQLGTLMAFTGASTESIIHGMVGVIDALETEGAETKNPIAVPTVSYTETEQAIVDMLQENTGASMLDSGGVYGRAFERNRKIQNFKDRDTLKVTIDSYGIELSIDIFQYLTSYLELDATAKKLQKQFERYMKKHSDMWETECMQKFMDLKSKHDEMGHGITNTYNYDNALGGTLQYGVFTLDGEGQYSDNCYIILQIHGGCDVRGGYTDPKIFKLLDFDYFLIAQSDLYADCPCDYCMAESDNSGYDWNVCNKAKRDNENLENHIKGLSDVPYEDVEFENRYTIEGNQAICKRCHKPLTFSACLG